MQFLKKIRILAEVNARFGPSKEHKSLLHSVKTVFHFSKPSMKRTSGIAFQLTFTLLFLLVSLGIQTAAHAQCEIMAPPPGNAGTDFLLCFEQNDVPDLNPFDSAACYVYVASTDFKQDTVVVTCRRYPSMSDTIFLSPGGYASRKISDQYSDIWITSTDSAVDNRVIRVRSTGPIVCYGMNYKLNTADAFLALPENKGSSAPDYRIMSYTNSSFLPSAMPSQFCVAAFEDGTTVQITPAANTLTSANLIPKTGHPAGQTFSITLDAGQCIQVQTDPFLVETTDPNAHDLTGSTVTSDKPIAVYAGHARTEIPFNFYRSDGGTSRDHIIEQMPPTESWGSTYVLSAIDIDVAGNKRPEGDMLRVLAKDDNTVVSINGVPWRTLNSMKYADSLITGAVVVTATAPILVGEYAHTSVSSKGDNGDPFLAIVPSMDQTHNDYTFFVSDNPVFVVQKVVITAKAACKDDIALDGNAIPGALFKAIPGGQFYLMELAVTPGAHRLTTSHTDADAFTILSYGLGYVVSYGYTAGQLLVPKSALMMESEPKPVNGHSINNNRVEMRNITFDDLYLDQAIFTPDDPADARFNIHLREPLDPENGRIAGAQSAALHLACDEQLDRPLHGTLTIYNHQFQWHNLQPASHAWTYYPEGAAAGVEGSGQGVGALQAELYPNPITADGVSAATLTFQMPQRADIEAVLFDELGRPVRMIADASYAEGPHDIRIPRILAGQTLQPGTYRLAVRSRTLATATELLLVVQ